MLDFDAVIIGSGPAGLTAAIYLARARYRTLVLEKDQFGGKVMNIDLIENYPGFSEGISGPDLASEMIGQAVKAGARLETGEVSLVRADSDFFTVDCTDGSSYKSTIVIMAAGSRARKLGVPGEIRFTGKGLIHCALCDGSQFANKTLAVCGGGDAGITEALYMAKIAAKVLLIEAMPTLTGTAILRERMAENPKIELRCGCKVVEIKGDDKVQALEVMNKETGVRETLAVDGVLVYVGNEPNNDCLKNIAPLDEHGRFIVDPNLGTNISGLIVAGDIRGNSPCQVSSAVGDGATAAISAQRLLQTRVYTDREPSRAGKENNGSGVRMDTSGLNSGTFEKEQHEHKDTASGKGSELCDEWELITPETGVFVESVLAKTRSSSLKGKTILLRRNDKPNSDVFLDRVGRMLVERLEGIRIVKAWDTVTGSDAAKPGADALKQIAALKPDLVISAQGD
ncbi:MAG TPA: FAD-dependent oxidoreductase [Syntrophorhabdaceae bacterium]|nr:FAD-dependent oxidoreductase [Syntrophorhabdaceae bacterium]